MKIRAESKEGVLRLRLMGELDHHAANAAMREIDGILDRLLPRDCALDLSGLNFMDSSGIALILKAQQRMKLLDGSLLVCHVPEQAKRVLDAAGIGRLVTIR